MLIRDFFRLFFTTRCFDVLKKYMLIYEYCESNNRKKAKNDAEN